MIDPTTMTLIERGLLSKKLSGCLFAVLPSAELDASGAAVRVRVTVLVPGGAESSCAEVCTGGCVGSGGEDDGPVPVLEAADVPGVSEDADDVVEVDEEAVLVDWLDVAALDDDDDDDDVDVDVDVALRMHHIMIRAFDRHCAQDNLPRDGAR